MEDVQIIDLYGTKYNVKDQTARNNAGNALDVAQGAQTAATTAQTTATEAKTAANSAQSSANLANTNIRMQKKEVPVISYETSSETITITKGI